MAKKITFLFVALAVASILVITPNVQDAFGYMKSTNTLSPVKSYGSANAGIVCGDRLCSEPKPEPPKIVLPNSTQSIEELISKFQEMKSESSFNSTNFNYTKGDYNVPVTLDLRKGFFAEKFVYSIITGTNSTLYSDLISSTQKTKGQFSPGLGNFSTESIPYVYSFRNGVDGDGIYGFQGEIYTTIASKSDYSPVVKIVDVEWNPGYVAKVITSERDLKEAVKYGQVTIDPTNVLVNMPQIIWPDGQIPVKADKDVSNNTPYTGGQIVNLDIENQSVTFIARLNWINTNQSYYIITDTFPLNPAKAFGANYTPILDKFFNSTTSKIYHFMNGPNGPGAYGFQPGLFEISDDGYSGYCKVFAAKWENQTTEVVKSVIELERLAENEKLIVFNARPMNSNHIISCINVNPFS